MSSLCFWFVYFTLDAVYKVKADLGFTDKNMLIDCIKVYVKVFKLLDYDKS